MMMNHHTLIVTQKVRYPHPTTTTTTTTTTTPHRNYEHMSPGGYLVQKTLRGCAANMGSKISLLVYEWSPIKCKNLVYEWVDFSKVPQIWAKIGSNLRKFWEKRWFCSKFGQKLDRLVYEWVTFSWKNWYLYGSTFKFRGSTSLPKPNLSTPPGTYGKKFKSDDTYVMQHRSKGGWGDPAEVTHVTFHHHDHDDQW